MRYPVFDKGSRSIKTVRTFGGFNTLKRISENEFSEMENICFDNYPALSVRKKRSTLGDIGFGKASLFFNDGLGWVTGSNNIFYKATMASNPGLDANVGTDDRVCVNMGSKVLFSLTEHITIPKRIHAVIFLKAWTVRRPRQL